ncbi:MAG TPA: monooxygenase [Acidimicrobiales bacterium]|nr:monooxygenase [Acidimicrobiales bacterium]
MTTQESVSEGYRNNRVGPILRSGDVALAAVDAVEVDNPDKEVSIEDRAAYVRIECEGECVLTRETMEEMLGRHFEMSELEVNLSSFSGQIDMSADRVRFYLNRKI